MVCQACGNPVTADVHFCPRCGAQIVNSAAPPPPPSIYPPMYVMQPPRVQRNLRTLGILWCVFGAYRVLAGFIGIFVLRVMTFRDFDRNEWQWGHHLHGAPWAQGAPWIGPLLAVVAIFSVVTAFLAFLVGFSLMTRQSWGRVLAIVVAILSLLKFPIGTALGIYTLWVLIPAQSGMEYDTIAGRG